MKRMLSILLAAMLLCVAMAPLATAGAEQEPVTLRVTWWGSQTRHDLTMAAIEKFEEKYPYITVEAEFTSWDGYWSKLATQVAGGLMPDVIQMDYQYLNQYAQSGVLADLTPFFESGAIDVSNVAQSVIDSGAVNGTVYALSTGTNALGFEKLHDAGREQVAADDEEVAGRVPWCGLLDQARDLPDGTLPLVVLGVRIGQGLHTGAGDDAIAAHLVGGNGGDRDDGGAPMRVGDALHVDAHLAIGHEVVPQKHEEGVVPRLARGAEHGMPQALGLILVDEAHRERAGIVYGVRLGVLAPVAQHVLVATIHTKV